jgi:hypothetical protein
LSGDAVFAEGLTRVYRILGAGFYDPGSLYDVFGSRFVYEVFMRAVVEEEGCLRAEWRVSKGWGGRVWRVSETRGAGSVGLGSY